MKINDLDRIFNRYETDPAFENLVLGLYDIVSEHKTTSLTTSLGLFEDALAMALILNKSEPFNRAVRNIENIDRAVNAINEHDERRAAKLIQDTIRKQENKPLGE
jgi:hypothetical protein